MKSLEVATAFVLALAVQERVASSAPESRTEEPPGAGCHVRGRLVTGGRPTRNVSITFRKKVLVPRAGAPAEEHRVRPREDGSFELDAMEPGEYAVSIIVSEHFVTTRQVVVPDAPSMELELRIFTSKIRGRVTSAADARPVFVVFLLQTPEGENGWMAGSEKDGSYEIPLLAPGTYDVCATNVVRSDSEEVPLATQVKRVEVADGATVDLDYRLDAGTPATVEMLDESGDRASGKVVSIIPTGDAPMPSIPSGVLSGRDGVAELDGALAPGTYVAKVRVERIYAYSEPTKVELGEEARFQVVVPPAVEARVRGVDERGQPAMLSKVSAFDDHGRIVAKQWKFEGALEMSVVLPRGKLRVEAESPTTRGSVEIDVSPGKSLDIPIVLAGR